MQLGDDYWNKKLVLWWCVTKQQNQITSVWKYIYKESSFNIIINIKILLFVYQFILWIILYAFLVIILDTLIMRASPFTSVRAGLLRPVSLALQASLSVAFSRQEYWSGLLCPSLGIFATQKSNLHLLHLMYCSKILYLLSQLGNSVL